MKQTEVIVHAWCDDYTGHHGGAQVEAVAERTVTFDNKPRLVDLCGRCADDFDEAQETMVGLWKQGSNVEPRRPGRKSKVIEDHCPDPGCGWGGSKSALASHSQRIHGMKLRELRRQVVAP